MRALQQTDHGDPDRVIEIVELSEPQPSAGEIVIAMEAAALHLADIKNFTGEKGFARSDLPRIPGYEGVGRVVRVGPGVTSFAVGDRVFPPLGAGTFCQQVCVAADRAVPAPEGDAQQLALLTVNGTTAAFLLEDYATLRAGDWVLQNGANSSCGRFIIALAKDRGVRSCNIVRRPELADELYELGADRVIVDCEDPDTFAELVADATDHAPIALGIDMVSGSATLRIGRAMPPGGQVINYGFISGQPAQFSFLDMVRGVKLAGMFKGFTARTPEQLRDLRLDLAERVSQGSLRARIAAAYPLERCYEAFRHAVRSGEERQGKIIILPNH